MNDPIKPWTTRLVEFAFAVLTAALMLHWAWALLRPLLPVVAGVFLISAVVRWAIVRRDDW